ncbi:MAG: hypothetical protein RDU89_10585 [bacterium]|nr:hypothetical protein [bacterium]
MSGRWFVVLLIVIILSTFLHEVGHGVSATLYGHPVSTGFSRVGDYGRRPGDPDFRAHLASYRNPADLGPAVTLILAVLSTTALYWVQGSSAITLTAAAALANSMLRLIPLGLAYGALFATGTLGLEDEIAQGQLWYELSGIPLLRHLPALVSGPVSLVCLWYALRGIRLRLRGLTAGALAKSSLAALLAALPVLELLDRHLRINWP